MKEELEKLSETESLSTLSNEKFDSIQAEKLNGLNNTALILKHSYILLESIFLH